MLTRRSRLLSTLGDSRRDLRGFWPIVLIVLLLSGWNGAVTLGPFLSTHDEGTGGQIALSNQTPSSPAPRNLPPGSSVTPSTVTGFRPVGPTYDYTGFCDPTVYNVALNFSANGLSLYLSWPINVTASYSFVYGTTQPPTTSAGGSGLVKLVNLTASTTYYYSLHYSSTISRCQSYLHQGWYNQSFATGNGESGGNEGKCPVSYVIVEVTPIPNPSGGGVNISWTNVTGPQVSVPGYSVMLQLWQGSSLLHTYNNPSRDPYPISGLPVASYRITVQANALGPLSGCIATGYAQATFYTGCVNTVVQGFANWNASTIPVFGAAVIINSSGNQPWTYVTDVSGRYYLSFGCGGANSVLVTVNALGFAGTSKSLGSLTPHKTYWFNASLYQLSTDNNLVLERAGSHTEHDYNLDLFVPHTSVSLPVINTSLEDGGFHYVSSTVSWVSTGGSGEPPAPPNPENPDGKVLQLTGTDSSTSDELADVFYDLHAPSPFGDVPKYRPSLSAPMYFEFDIYVPSSSFSSRFMVDAILSNGDLISNVTDSTGNTIHDTSGLPCMATTLQYVENEWITEECDVSALGHINITDFLFEYVNDQGGGYGSSFTAYFDAPRLVQSVDPSGVANGGFEAPSEPDGWAQGGFASLISVPVPSGLPSMDDGGTQYLLIGDPPSSVCSQIRCPQTGSVYQIFRPSINSGDQWYGAVNLSMNISMGNSCTPASQCTAQQYDTSSFSLGIQDLTSGIVYNIASGNGSVIHSWGAGTFQTVSFNITFLLGHLLKLTLAVYSGYYYPFQSGRTVDDAWLAADAIRIVYPFEKFIADSGATSSASLRLYGSQYWMSGCYGSSPQGYLDIGQSVSGVTDTFLRNYTWDGPNGSRPTTPVFVNVTAGIDAYAVDEACNGDDIAWLMFTAHADANATGYVKQTPGVVVSCPPGSSCAQYMMLQQLFITITETHDGGTNLPADYQLGPGSSGGDGIVNVHNISVLNSGPYSLLTQDQAQTIMETIAFVGLSLLITGGTAGLELPLVFEAAIGAAEDIAEGALHLTLFDQYFADFNPTSTSDCSSTQPVDTGSQLTGEWRECVGLTTTPGGYQNTTSASMTFGLEAPIGAVSGGSGGSYTFTVQTEADYCYYEGNLGGHCEAFIPVTPTATATLQVVSS